MYPRYLSDQHDATTIGVLLGMSACCRASADTTVARMLFLHLPARHPNNFPEIELSPHVQVRQAWPT
jgi:anaphase-promoting complex subunit 1